MGIDVELVDQLRDMLRQAKANNDPFEVADLEMRIYVMEQRMKKTCKLLPA